jgi:hypothetical protein
VTDNHEVYKMKRRDKYEPPQAVRLTDSDRAFGACSAGSIPGIEYRADGIQGTCVTGKSAGDGCIAGAGF